MNDKLHCLELLGDLILPHDTAIALKCAYKENVMRSLSNTLSYGEGKTKLFITQCQSDALWIQA